MIAALPESVGTCYFLKDRYWDRHAVDCLRALPPCAIVVVAERAIQGYAERWKQWDGRPDVTILAREEVK